MYHFADDISFLQIDKSYKKIQHNLNYDLKCLCNWLLANKIPLNTAKTELIFFWKWFEKYHQILKYKLMGINFIAQHILNTLESIWMNSLMGQLIVMSFNPD